MNTLPSRSRKSKRCDGFRFWKLFLRLPFSVGPGCDRELVKLGYKHALNTRLRSDANILLDTKMAEIASGVLDLESVSGNPIEENPDWNYSVFIEQSEQIGLLLVRRSSGTVRTRGFRSRSMSARFMPDPDYDPEEDAE